MIRLVSRNGTDALPVSMAEMAQHLKREDVVEDDDYINACLLAAIDWAERFTGIVLIDSTYDFSADRFPVGSTLGLLGSTTIYLRRAPLLEVVSVTYRDSGGASVVLDTAGYSVDYAGSSIYLPLSSSWPTTDGAANAVTVRFRAGYIDYDTYPPSVGDIPDTLKAAIKLYAAELYGNRDNERLVDNSSRVPYGAEMLLRLHRIDDSLA
jgi:uncharacterized phiE125 gp8 family phage protein